MTLAEKIAALRKQQGWSQETFAEKMDVTRQAVSKWESAQSVPDIDKLVKISNLFGVTTDYLLKEENDETFNETTETDDYIVQVQKPERNDIKQVTLEEAKGFIEIKKKTADWIAFAVYLCILSPICLLIMGGLSEEGKFSENFAGGIGVIVLLLIAGIACAIFIYAGTKTSDYLYLQKDAFETSEELRQWVRNERNSFRSYYSKNNIIGTCICIFSVIPLFIGIMIDDENQVLILSMLALLMALAGIGVIFFVRVGIVWESYKKLLQEEDYTVIKKESVKKSEIVASVYWLLIVAAYLGYSFVTNNWRQSWIIFVVAGVIFPVVNIIALYVTKKNKK